MDWSGAVFECQVQVNIPKSQAGSGLRVGNCSSLAIPAIDSRLLVRHMVREQDALILDPEQRRPDEAKIK